MSEENGVSSAEYQALRKELREAEILGSTAALLAWDQETMMPRRATPFRGQQAGLLSQLVHERRTSERLGELLSRCEQDAELTGDPLVAANLREIRRMYDQGVRVPSSLISEIAETTTNAQYAWRDARQNSSFGSFAPWLEKIVALSQRRAEYLAREEMPDQYDALLDLYEPGARTADIVRVFNDLRERLTPLIQEIAGASRRPNDRIHHIAVPIPQQQAFNTAVATRLGFDFEAGRLDTSTHPFCQGIGPGDTRITTRYREEGFPDALSSTLHETGHALYEQNLPKDRYLGEPLGDHVSLGIHESQSRLWENLVGRSRPFWEWALPQARETFGSSLDGFQVDEVYAAMNIVEPSLIRVDSDEATYNLHIMLRFDLERMLLSGDLTIRDLPAAWNDRVRTDLGVEVPDDRRGVLQDVHWSMGAIGYFPTYTLGNLYAAQIWTAVRDQLPTLEEQISRGEFGELLGWLQREIFQHGRRYTAPELCRRITGEELNADPFMTFLEGKLRPIYGI
jgi:carboxypeptidase Taq